jgi:dihydrofolate reductase
MGRITAFESVSLDGVMQAPGRPDEDRRGGFAHGGWATPYADPAMWKGMGGPGSLLFGRRTYEDFAGFWPKQGDNPFTPALNETRKYVASRTLEEPLPWQNSTLLRGEATRSVTKLKDEVHDDLMILGSGELVRSLIAQGLVDEYVLLIHPLVLGSGRHLFSDDDTFTMLNLVQTETTSTGVIIATYRSGSVAERP